MSRRKVKGSSPASAAASWAIILVDGSAIRAKALRQYQRALRDLESARREIEQFEHQDQPAFSRWLSCHFGAFLTQIRDLTHQLASQRELLTEIQTEAFWGECSYVRAYERVMWRRKHPDDTDQAEAESGEGRQSRQSGRQRESEQRQQRNGTRGGPSQDQDPHLEEDGSRWPDPGNPSTQLKQLYRALARRLHPDVQTRLTAQKKEWWHQAQAAYQNGDAEQLQVILTLCEIEEQGSAVNTSVSLLLRITREYRSSLRALRSKLSQYRLEPAWNFSQMPDRSLLLKSTDRMMQANLAAIKAALEAVESQIAMWARQARLSASRPGRRPGIRIHPEFRF
ncbi:MAG: hypothetical protein U1G07_23750 [Verrucomicrobiota bacterium]